MYSPKIREDLIPRVYRAARKANLHMTTWVNQAVEKSLPMPRQNNKPKPTGRIVAMKRVEPDQNNRLETKDTFVIAKGDAGYRVCSPLMPAKQYVVTGIPNDPQCTCPDFMHPDCPPGWQCEHIQAVLNEVNGTDRTKVIDLPVSTGNNGADVPPSHNGKNGNGKSPRGRNGKGVVMLLKRSVSPDGRIDSLSVEFSCAVASVTTGGIKELAQVILALQSEITAGFLAANGKKRNGNTNGNGSESHHGNGNGHVPDNAVPGQLLGVASMPSRWGQRLFLNVLVNGQVLKMFGADKQLAEAVKDAGYPSVADRLVEGYTLNLPCRVTTKPNGKYVNVERVYPPQAGVPARV